MGNKTITKRPRTFGPPLLLRKVQDGGVQDYPLGLKHKLLGKLLGPNVARVCVV